jgi:F0F1-type ATP synthase assembly protein I
MVAATAIIWAVGVIIAAYAGTPPSFIIILIVLWFLWGGWQISQRNPESRWWN